MSFLYRPVVYFAHLFKLRHEVLFNLFFGNATNGSIFRHETDVCQVVENREERYLCKLGNTRDEYKLFILVVSLQYSKNLTVDSRAFFLFGCSP